MTARKLGRPAAFAVARIAWTRLAAVLAALLIALRVGIPAAANAQTPAAGGPGDLRGVVLTSDGVPVSGASVTLTNAGQGARSVVTREDGAFLFPAVAPGRAGLHARRIGFRAESLAVALPLAGASPLAIRLTPAPQALAPVVVQGRAPDAPRGPIADFYRRRATGMGRYITRADIERRQPLRTTDLLRTVPGVSVRGNFGGSDIRYRNGRCAPEVYVDGTPLSAAPFDFDAVPPSAIEGIEVHSGATVPVEFRRAFGRASCGTILLWTRRGEPGPPRRRGKPVTSEDLAKLVAELRLYTAEQVDTVARPPHDFAERVRLPDSVRVEGALGVIAEFVVDPAGRVEPATINVVASPSPVLSDAVRAALPGAAFTPAVRSGRAVRQLVQLTVRFDSSAPRR